MVVGREGENWSIVPVSFLREVIRLEITDTNMFTPSFNFEGLKIYTINQEFSVMTLFVPPLSAVNHSTFK